MEKVMFLFQLFLNDEWNIWKHYWGYRNQAAESFCLRQKMTSNAFGQQAERDDEGEKHLVTPATLTNYEEKIWW